MNLKRIIHYAGKFNAEFTRKSVVRSAHKPYSASCPQPYITSGAKSLPHLIIMTDLKRDSENETHKKIIRLAALARATPCIFKDTNKSKRDRGGRNNEGGNNIYVIIRDYNLPTAARLKYARRILKTCSKSNVKALIAMDEKRSAKILHRLNHEGFRIDGIHLPQHMIEKLSALKENNRWLNLWLSKNRLISAASHTLTAITKAQKIHCDIAIYSPVFATKSHPGSKGCGVKSLKDMVKNASAGIKSPNKNLPIYAMGGINESSIHSLDGAGITGIAGIFKTDSCRSQIPTNSHK